MGEVATPCPVLSVHTTAMEVDRRFDADDTLAAVGVRTMGGGCTLIPRGAFYQHLTGRLGYGYALHRPRRVLEMEVEPAPSFPSERKVIDVGLSLIEGGQISRTPSSAQAVAGDAIALDALGQQRILQLQMTNLLHDPAVGAIVVNIRDITERLEFEDRLRHDARHDPLTRLPNRVMFAETLEVELRGRCETARRVPRPRWLQGGQRHPRHAAGDAVLCSVAASVREVLRSDDLLARLGGDEFALLIRAGETSSSVIEVVDRVVERVLNAVRRPIAVHGERVTPSASIGVALAEGVDGVVQLLQRADVAMYQAKLAGRNQAVWWNRGLHASVVERHLMARDLDEAAQRGQLHLVYQPQIELPENRTVGYEALLRWDRARVRHGLARRVHRSRRGYEGDRGDRTVGAAPGM